MLQEFKKFAMRGSVVDLAIGVIIGAAFGRIVDSLVGDIIMPVIGRVFGEDTLAIGFGEGLEIERAVHAMASSFQRGRWEVVV